MAWHIASREERAQFLEACEFEIARLHCETIRRALCRDREKSQLGAPQSSYEITNYRSAARRWQPGESLR
jgi:hypothetical protein